MSDSRLREKLESGDFIAAPGIHDMISALIANKLSVEVIYGSGYWLTASACGIPDAGIATYTEMLNCVARLAEVSDAAIIADADTGYGGLLNVERTVCGYESAGVSGIQLEDQVFPKACTHTMQVRCIPLEQMVRKIRVACASRNDQRNTLIVARTDARKVESFAATLRRAEAYAKAGGDIIFIESLSDETEMRRACSAIGLPMMFNMNDRGSATNFSTEELRQIGYRIAVWPSFLPLSMIHCLETSLAAFLEAGTSRLPGVPLADFDEFSNLIGFDRIRRFGRDWGDD